MIKYLTTKILALNMKGVVHYEQLERSRAITADIHCQQLDQVNETLHKKYSALVKTKDVIVI